MKLKRWSQIFLAATASIGAATGLVSCGVSNTVDYLYATSAKNTMGQINGYRVDSETGALSQIADSPTTVGRDPVSLAADAVGLNLYVVTFIDNTLSQIGIGTDGKLYPQEGEINPSGSEPVAVTVRSVVDGSGKLEYNLVFVVETFQPDYTVDNTGPGGLYVYKTTNTGSLYQITPVPQMVNGVASDYLPLGNTPTAVNITFDSQQVYVSDILASGQTANGCSVGQGAIQGYNMGFTTDSTNNNAQIPTGVLTPVTGSPFCAGTTPSAIASHPFSTFLYVTDSTQNQVTSYLIQKSNTASAFQGALTPLPTGPTNTGTGPDGITVNPQGTYAYVSNKYGPSVNGYAINQGTGQISALTAGTGGTGAQPGCVIVEPALGRFLYTANYEDGSVSGFTINPNTGALAGSQNSPYETNGLSQCVAAVPHGNHPIINDPAQTAGTPLQ
jgi:6-phosphogluconolactonase